LRSPAGCTISHSIDRHLGGHDSDVPVLRLFTLIALIGIAAAFKEEEMKVFLAGASGALGVPLARQLLHHGHEVLGLSRDPGSGDLLLKLGITVNSNALTTAASASPPPRTAWTPRSASMWTGSISAGRAWR
jgi:hypothetical protein